MILKEKLRAFLRNLLKGFFIGSTMTVPGVSGGTMAMVADCYDPMIAAVSHFFGAPLTALLLLLPIAGGAAAGMYLVAGFISHVLLVRFPFVTRFFFLGAVCGSIPMMIKKTPLRRGEGGRFLPFLLAGLLGVQLLALLPAGIFVADNSGFTAILLRFLAGILVAVALVLPGISTSQVLLMLGLYEPLLTAVSAVDGGYLLPFGAGLVLGTFTLAKILNHLLEKRQTETWFVILGFVAGSLLELFPGLPQPAQLPGCLCAAAAGFLILYLITKKSGQVSA